MGEPTPDTPTAEEQSRLDTMAGLEAELVTAVGDRAEALAASLRSLRHNNMATDAEAILADGPRNVVEAERAGTDFVVSVPPMAVPLKPE